MLVEANPLAIGKNGYNCIHKQDYPVVPYPGASYPVVPMLIFNREHAVSYFHTSYDIMSESYYKSTFYMLLYKS